MHNDTIAALRRAQRLKQETKGKLPDEVEFIPPPPIEHIDPKSFVEWLLARFK